MFAKKNIVSKFVGIMTVSILVLSLLVPSLSFGREFNTDRTLSVYPNNEVLDFGAVNVGDDSTKSFVVENTGVSERTVSIATFPNGDFSYTGARELVIPPREEVLIPVHFDPSNLGTQESSFVIVAKNTNERKELTVIGNATRNANNGLEISATEVQFPTTPINNTTTAQVTIKNRNNTDIRINASINSTTNFRINSASNFILDPSEEKTLLIEFLPNRDQRESAILTLNTNSRGQETIKIPLLGPGLDEPIVERRIRSFAQLSTESTLIGLGTLSVHQQRLETINITNTGNEDLEVEITDDIEGPFSVDLGSNDKTTAVIEPGEQGKIRVSFMPDYQGVYTSTFKIETNAVNLPEVTFAVSGTGINTGAQKFDFKLSNQMGNTVIKEGERTSITYNTNIPARVSVLVKKDNRVIESLEGGSAYNDANRSYTTFWTAENATPGNYKFYIRAVSNDGQVDTVNRSFEVIPKHISTILVRNNPSDAYFNVPNPTINIDRGEKAYFNFYIPTRSSIVYTIKNHSTNKVVVQRAFGTIEAGTHNYQFSWDGRSYNGNKVSEGDYTFEFKMEPTNSISEVRIYEGSLNVERNNSHVGIPYASTSVGSYIPAYTPQARVISSYYTENRNTELRNNENLITELVASPAVINEFNQESVISFNTLHKGKATASIKDVRGNLVRKLTLNRNLVDGYHHEELFWHGDTSQGTAAVDGRYSVEIHTAQGNETDTDIAYITLNRGHRSETSTSYNAPLYQNNTANSVRPYQPSYTSNCAGFGDVYGTESFCDAVSFVVDQGIFEGSMINGQKVLRADDYLTRAEATAVVLRIMKMPISSYNPSIDGNLGFSDLDTDAWYMSHIKTIIKSATQQQSRYGNWVRNIMQGYPDGTIRPNTVMSRAEFYKVFLESAVNSQAVNANFTLDYHITKAPFSDTAVNELTEWYLPYAEWATKYLNKTEFAKQYFDSYDLNQGVRRFKGKKGITRGEVIDLIFNTQTLGLVNY
jgi:flagellar hook assembly protein FlgD